MRLKFQNIQDIEIFHKLICLRAGPTIRRACRLIIPFACPSNPIVEEYIKKLTYMKKRKMHFIKMNGGYGYYRSCSCVYDIDGNNALSSVLQAVVLQERCWTYLNPLKIFPRLYRTRLLQKKLLLPQ